MRKFSLLLVALLVITSGAFAADAVDFTIGDASASATFGYDLDGGTMGITNTAALDLRITLIDDQSVEYGTEGELRGYLKVDDFALDAHVANAENDTNGASATIPSTPAFVLDTGVITGILYLGPAYVKIYGSFNDVNEAAAGMLVTPVFHAFGTPFDVKWDNFATAPIGVGFAAGDMLDLELVLASVSDWDTDDVAGTAAGDSWFVLAALADIDVAGFNIDVEAASWLNADGPDADTTGAFGEKAAIGVGLSYSLPVGDFTLEPYAGFDLLSVTGATVVNSYEITAGANLKWAGTSGAGVTIFGQSETVSSGVGAEVSIYNNGNTVTTDDPIVIRVGLYESNGDDGLFPVIGAALVTEVRMTGSNMDLGVGAELRANLGTLRPYFGVMLQDEAGTGAGLDLESAINLGATVHIIDNVTFTIDYASGNLLGTAVTDATRAAARGGNVYGDGTGALNSASRMGEFAITTKIDY